MKAEEQEHRHIDSPARSSEWAWKLWPLLPIYPYGQRRTLQTEVVPDQVWMFEQIQGILYVVVPIRMTVVKLEAGGLLVYAPIAPTPECLRLVNELVVRHGDVRYIILPTISGLEHKIFVGPFARHFPTAQVFVAPNQWSFPLNLPLSWLGFPRGRTQILPEDSGQAPFCTDFDYAMLSVGLGLGTFGEVAFFHRRSRTLLVTDSVVSVPEEPPAIVQLNPYPLLFHARDSSADVVEDSAATRRKGWKRIALFAFYFRPSALDIIPTGPSIRAAMQAPDRSRKAYFGWFPFQWKPTWERSFDALRGNGRLFVAPILQQLILNRAPQETLEWASAIARWSFERIIPCHFSAPIAATPAQFRQAFSFLEKSSPAADHPMEQHPLPEEDFELLKELEVTFNKRGVVPPPKEKV